MLCKAFNIIRLRLKGAARESRLQKALLYPPKSTDLFADPFKTGLNIKRLVMDEAISPRVSPRTAKAIFFSKSVSGNRKNNTITLHTRTSCSISCVTEGTVVFLSPK